MKHHILIYLALVSMLAACEPKPATTAPPVMNTRQPSITANVMNWETNGGGQITFSITQNGDVYDVLVTSRQFKHREERFTITVEAGPVYEALSRIMQDQGSIGSYAPDGPPRGSWTTLKFSDGAQSSTYKDAIVISYRDLNMIYEYVVAQIE